MLDVAARNVVVARNWACTIVAQAPQQSFGEKLRRAVKTRTHAHERREPRAADAAAVATDDSSFAEKLKAAIKARRTTVRAGTRKEHEQFVERESARFKPLQQRERSKGE
jgi:hypothetical protein